MGKEKKRMKELIKEKDDRVSEEGREKRGKQEKNRR